MAHQTRPQLLIDVRVDLFDLRPTVLRPGEIASDAIGTNDIHRLGTCLGHQARREDDAFGVDDVVGEQRGDQFPPERMAADLILQSPRNRLWEVALHIGQ